MAIFKANIQEQYVVIPNETAQNAKLTFEARGLLALMLSLPADWEIHKSWLIEQSPNCGRDRLNRLINELIDAGYMKKDQERSLNGEFLRNDYYVYPVSGNWKSVDGEPVDGQPPTTKETVIQSKQVDKVIGSSNDKPTNKYPDEFEVIWKHYPKREGSNPKNKAYSACKARLKEGKTWEDLGNGVVRYHLFCQQKGQLNTAYVMQASRFFGPELNFDNEWLVNQSQPNAFDNNSTDWIHTGDIL